MSRRGLAGPARILCVDKPVGPTSFDVVRQVRRVSGQRRVGHGGTLDPFATGLLVVGLGPATRLLGYLARGEKVYRAGIHFGIETDSGDPTGEVIAQGTVGFGAGELRRTLERFVGVQAQVPPLLSAVRVEGRRSYERARAGEEFELPAREVEVHAIELLEAALPLAHVRVTCSGGTYIRSLARDIGRALGCGAHLRSLRRERVGAFTLDRAVALDRIDAQWCDGRAALAPLELVRGWTCLTLDPQRVLEVRNGRQPDASWWEGEDWTPLPDRVAFLDRSGELVAVAESPDGRSLALATVLPAQATAPALHVNTADFEEPGV